MLKMAEANAPCEPVYYSSKRGGTKIELNGFVYNKDNLTVRCTADVKTGHVIANSRKKTSLSQQFF